MQLFFFMKEPLLGSDIIPKKPLKTLSDICFITLKPSFMAQYLQLSLVEADKSFSKELYFNACDVSEFCNTDNSWIILISHRIVVDIFVI